MSGIDTPSTPAPSDSNKRELTSPFDPNDPKKARAHSASSETSEMDTSTTRVHLCDEDFEKISSLLTSTFERKISLMISSITDGVNKGLNDRIKTLESENVTLKETVAKLEERLEKVEDEQDRAQQYSRRNCLRLSGIKETPTENTDQIILDVAKAVDATITLDDIERSHRLGPPRPSGINGNRPKPRDIIVKLVSYRSRSKLFKSKSNLRNSGFKGSFINEDLTRSRSDLFFQCRLLVRSKHVLSTWTSDGVILVKDTHNKVHRIETKRQFAEIKIKVGA